MKWVTFFLVASAVAVGLESNIPGEKTDKDRVICNTSTIGGFNVTGCRCRFFDEVMTGVVSLDPLTIRCSRLQVTCHRQGKPVDVAMQEEAKDE